MSRAGCSYGDAVAESFMKTLKTEEVDGRPYEDLAHATCAIGAFIGEVSNRDRLHSALNDVTPVEFEEIKPGAAARQPRVLTKADRP